MTTPPATRFRSLTLLASSLRQRHWHLLFWVMSTVYLVGALLIVFLFSIVDRRGDPRNLFAALQFLHVALAIGLPALRAGRLVDDRTSGSLQFAQLAGFSAGAWIRFRLLAIATECASLWVLRVPFYSFLLNGGGVTWMDLLWAELIQTVLALTVAQIGLLTAARAELSPQTLFGTAAVSLINFFLMTPTGVTIFIARVWSVRMPLVVSSAAETLRSLSLFSYTINPPATAEGRLAALCGLLLHLVAGILASFWLRRILYSETEPGVATSKSRIRVGLQSGGQGQPSRRVWGDPFFWQASEYYFANASQRRKTVLFFAASLTVGIAVSFRFSAASLALGCWMIAACVTPEMLPTTCAGFELKEKTLSALAVLPCGGREIYFGWKRAGEKYRLAAWLAGCLCLAVIAWRDPVLALAWGAVAIAAVWSIPPLAFIEALRAQERVPMRIAFRVAIGAIVGPLASFLALHLPYGVPILAGTLAAAGCFYRPRAMRQMDEIFVRVSSR